MRGFNTTCLVISSPGWLWLGRVPAAPSPLDGGRPHARRFPRGARDSHETRRATGAAATFLLPSRPKYSAAAALLDRGRAGRVSPEPRSPGSTTGKNPDGE